MFCIRFNDFLPVKFIKCEHCKRGFVFHRGMKSADAGYWLKKCVQVVCRLLLTRVFLLGQDRDDEDQIDPSFNKHLSKWKKKLNTFNIKISSELQVKPFWLLLFHNSPYIIIPHFIQTLVSFYSCWTSWDVSAAVMWLCCWKQTAGWSYDLCFISHKSQRNSPEKSFPISPMSDNVLKRQVDAGTDRSERDKPSVWYVWYGFRRSSTEWL